MGNVLWYRFHLCLSDESKSITNEIKIIKKTIIDAPGPITIIKGIDIKDSKYKIISGHNQKVVSKRDEIIDELSANICTRHNWLATMNKLIENGIKTFFECGAGKSLSKTAKFIEGDYKIYTIKTLDNITSL